jgi:signal transduction histidine kinase
LKEKNIKIEVKEVETLIIENNIYYLDRLFWNLISNSIFYNNWNNTIEIAIFKDKVTIKDKWIWIGEEDLKRVFDRFHRNNDSSLYNNEWSGLGLTIVKKIFDSFGLTWQVTESKKGFF